jgi:predicted DNA-binding protein
MTTVNNNVVNDAEDLSVASEVKTRSVQVTYFCGHIGDVVVDDTAEGVEWALEFAQSENCPKCDASYEREAREAHEEEVYS